MEGFNGRPSFTYFEENRLNFLKESNQITIFFIFRLNDIIMSINPHVLLTQPIWLLAVSDSVSLRKPNRNDYLVGSPGKTGLTIK